MACLFIGQIAVFSLHPFISCFNIGIAFRGTPSRIALIVNPLPKTILYTNRVAFRLHFGGEAKPLNIHHLADIFGVEPGIARGDIAAHRVRNDADGGKVQLVD